MTKSLNLYGVGSPYTGAAMDGAIQAPTSF